MSVTQRPDRYSIYYSGGLAGAVILGQINLHYGWPGTATALTNASVLAMALAYSLRTVSAEEMDLEAVLVLKRQQ